MNRARNESGIAVGNAPRSVMCNKKHRYNNPKFQNCSRCGEPFVIDRPERKYCSHKCYAEARVGHTSTPTRHVINTCVVCGNEFETGGRLGKRNKRYCSRKCRDRVRYRRGAESNPIEAIDAAYIAGFLTVKVVLLLILNRGVAKIRIAITNTNHEIIEWLRDVTGIGTVTYKKRKREEHKDVWTWNCNGGAAESILRQIRPYLRIKTRQTDLAFSIQNRLRIPAQKADRTWQSEVRDQMRALNRRGSIAQ